ncbi:hypothetical protein [Cylindrospermopsis raciborskii]|uniref:hypothetical protein n=1 Tax=Cylindrospermopsis raciborskii TaxID=77022 RepID=UPI001F378BB4|nr:hypothetical protein [Cylindrospermopsis raciborskii]MCZ2207784.1 hypothetical protein [Cylindrospermopsis raciborskii PAMP2011]
MKSINISLPDTMGAYVEELVAQSGYSTGARILSGISATRPKTPEQKNNYKPCF